MKAIYKLEDQIKAFVSSGFKRSKFTNSIYEALSVDANVFIAHFNRDGFYRARFEDREGLKQTLKSLATVKPVDDIKRIVRQIPSLYEDATKTYKLGEPIFKAVGGRIGCFFDTNTKYDTVTNLLGFPDVFLTKGFYKSVLEMTCAPIVTCSDSIAYDWILNLPDQGLRVSKDRLIILVHVGSGYKTNGGHCSASEQRLKKAQAKLKGLGYKTKYFSSLDKAKAFIESLKIQGGAS